MIQILHYLKGPKLWEFRDLKGTMGVPLRGPPKGSMFEAGLCALILLMDLLFDWPRPFCGEFGIARLRLQGSRV